MNPGALLLPEFEMLKRGWHLRNCRLWILSYNYHLGDLNYSQHEFSKFSQLKQSPIIWSQMGASLRLVQVRNLNWLVMCLHGSPLGNFACPSWKTVTFDYKRSPSCKPSMWDAPVMRANHLVSGDWWTDGPHLRTTGIVTIGLRASKMLVLLEHPNCIKEWISDQ